MKIRDDSPSLTTGQRVSLGLAVLCAAGAVLLAGWPRDWIEGAFGVEPDGGSGFFELLAIVVLAAAAAVLTARVVWVRRLRRSSAGEVA
jgi:hypothetical protein